MRCTSSSSGSAGGANGARPKDMNAAMTLTSASPEDPPPTPNRSTPHRKKGYRRNFTGRCGSRKPNTAIATATVPATYNAASTMRHGESCFTRGADTPRKASTRGVKTIMPMRSAVHHVHHLTGSDAPIAVRAVRTPEITPPRALISAQTHTKAMVFLSRPKVNGAGNMRRNTHAPTAASSVSPPQRPMLTTMLWPWSTSDARPATAAAARTRGQAATGVTRSAAR